MPNFPALSTSSFHLFISAVALPFTLATCSQSVSIAHSASFWVADCVLVSEFLKYFLNQSSSLKSAPDNSLALIFPILFSTVFILLILLSTAFSSSDVSALSLIGDTPSAILFTLSTALSISSVAVFVPSTLLNLPFMLSIAFEALSVAVISTLTFLFLSLSSSAFNALTLPVALSLKSATISISILEFAIVSSFPSNLHTKNGYHF